MAILAELAFIVYAIALTKADTLLLHSLFCFDPASLLLI